MSHGHVEGAGAAAAVPPASLPPVVAALHRLVDGLDRILVLVASIALLAGAFVLTESVVVRYVLQSSTDWQDETTVFLLVGTTFLSAPWVQSWRGHVAIEALSEILQQDESESGQMSPHSPQLRAKYKCAAKVTRLTHGVVTLKHKEVSAKDSSSKASRQ